MKDTLLESESVPVCLWLVDKGVGRKVFKGWGANKKYRK